MADVVFVWMRVRSGRRAVSVFELFDARLSGRFVVVSFVEPFSSALESLRNWAIVSSCKATVVLGFRAHPMD